MTQTKTPSGLITKLFSMWQPAVDAVYRADEDLFRDAYLNEHDIRIGIRNSEPLSLRELQMFAFAYIADGCGLGTSVAELERQLADIAAYREKQEEEPDDAGDHRQMALTFAVALMRMAGANPQTPHPPTVPLRSEWSSWARGETEHDRRAA